MIDDHALFREGVKLMLRSLDQDVAIDDAGDCAQALKTCAARTYDLVLLDLNLPGLKGMDALRAMREAVPETPLVVLTGEEGGDIVAAAIDAGAMGFIPKSSTPEVLIQALRLVFANGVYLPPTVLHSKPSPPPATSSKLGQLTPRQMDVLRWVIQGKPNKAIARELNIAEGTVKSHLSVVMNVLGATTRTQAVYAAAKLGLRLP